MSEAQKKETVVELVKMSDGRQVEFPGKRKLSKEVYIADNGTISIRADFRNGETLTQEVPSLLYPKCAAHGIGQKTVDEIAGVDDIDDCVLAISDLFDRIAKGEWTQAREANGMAGTSVLLQAIMQVKGLTKEKVQTFLATKDQKQKIALRNSDTFREAVKVIEAAKASKKTQVDTTDLEAELEGLA